MRYALINPAWAYEGSIYFGCRETHLPLEFGYAKLLLEAEGHHAEIIDGLAEGLNDQQIRDRTIAFAPDFVVVTTAPSYLFWRCAPPELRVPQQLCRMLKGLGRLVIVGPHGSTTPRPVLTKLEADFVVLGECEEVLPMLAGQESDWSSLAYRAVDGSLLVRGPNRSADMTSLPALFWSNATIAAHTHHHHRFDEAPQGPGAEMEASRGCPYHCTFCAKDNFRNSYRKRPLATVLSEIDGFIRQGVEYIYFIDEIFLPDAKLLAALSERPVKIGVQTRIDLWNEDMLTALARAGCVSMEAGVESITEAGRAYLDKRCKLSTEELTSRLVFLKRMIPFVQANLLAMSEDDAAGVEQWRQTLERSGVWANKPVPLFPYPGSPEYTRRWGLPDDFAWERAHDAYLHGFQAFSDIQEQQPQSLIELESLIHVR